MRETGYGIVVPGIDELKLEEPEIMKQGGRYGVRLKASAPSIHIRRIKQKYKNGEQAKWQVLFYQSFYYALGRETQTALKLLCNRQFFPQKIILQDKAAVLRLPALARPYLPRQNTLIRPQAAKQLQCRHRAFFTIQYAVTFT